MENLGFRRRIWLLFAQLGLEDLPRSVSASYADLATGLAGKHVAIVGNSRALADQDFGADIDAADIVIRINRAPMPRASSHGRRTDWLALATSLSRFDQRRIEPRRILWMSPKRKRLRARMVASDGFYLHPLQEYRRLFYLLQSPPTTGLMVIDLVACGDAASVTLFGFDFFASESLTGRRTAEQVPHNFATEKAWVDNLLVRDPRFRLRQ